MLLRGSCARTPVLSRAWGELHGLLRLLQKNIYPQPATHDGPRHPTRDRHRKTFWKRSVGSVRKPRKSRPTRGCHERLSEGCRATVTSTNGPKAVTPSRLSRRQTTHLHNDRPRLLTSPIPSPGCSTMSQQWSELSFNQCGTSFG